MKILIFMTQFYQLNGAERLAVELAEGLNKRGIHTDILSMYTEGLPGVDGAKQDLLNRGIPHVRFLGMKIHPPLTSLLPAILKLRRMIQAEGYDIVETSMSTPSIITAWACRGLAVRQVSGIHDVFTRERYNTVKDKFWRYSVRNNRKTRFYSISDYAVTHWIKYSRTLAARTRRVLNAIPKDCFEAVPDREAVRDELGISKDVRIALFVGRLLKRKGIDTIYDALAPILKEENLTVIYVGGEDSPEGFFPDDVGLLDRLKACIKQDGLIDRVRFLGRRDDVPRLMASSDVLVHPARIEGFGLVLVEALAAMLPVVASNVDGIPEVLAGTDSIMRVPDAPAPLREAVLTILNRTSQEAVQAIENGRRRAEEFRMDRRIDAMVQLFNDVQKERF